MTNRRKRQQSSSSIMLRNLITMVTILTVSLGVCIIIAVGHQLLEEVHQTTNQITTSLEKTYIDGDDDWQEWRRNNTLDTSASFVYIHNLQKDDNGARYFSPNTEHILQIKPIKIPFISHLYYRPDFGFLYHRVVHAKGIYYTLWQSMHSQLEILLRVILVTAILLGVTLIIMPLYIRRLTKHLTDPIVNLSQNTKIIASAEEPGSMRLPVPEQPTEVTDLATNFNELLVMLNKRQEQQKLFVMNAAHELRTPIATIRSHAQLIERHGKDHPEIIEKSVRYITDESRQMQQLIDELLALSRADQLVLDVHDIDLSNMIANTVQSLNNTFPQKFITTIKPNVHMIGNANAIDQILNSLLTNASKYSPEDSTIEIQLETNAQENYVITIKDQGQGISNEDKAHIFERFYRSAEVRGSVKGTGLGLAIADQLIKLMGGTIQVKDNHPQGSVFILTIPAHTT